MSTTEAQDYIDGHRALHYKLRNDSTPKAKPKANALTLFLMAKSMVERNVWRIPPKKGWEITRVGP